MLTLPTVVIFSLNLFSTLFMVGLIWFVQIVHYPLFSRVGSDVFREYQEQHQKRTTYVVAIPMIIEAITSVLLVWHPPLPNYTPLLLMGVALVFLIWASTAFMQVPQHTELNRGFQDGPYRVLVWSNWIRTIAWSLRGLLVCVIVGQFMFTATA